MMMKKPYILKVKDVDGERKGIKYTRYYHRYTRFL
jgi:hypothetical protein